MELRPWRRRRRRRLRLGRPDWTLVLGGLAGLLTGTVAAGEVWRVWRRGSAPLPAETDHVLEAGAEALGQTIEVAVAGYRGGSEREHALLNLMGSYSMTWAAARASAHVIRRKGRFGPVRNVRVGGRHIHHFVPGILLAFASGGLAITTHRHELEPWLAIPFGAGMALTLDESALLLQLDDVYWSEEGVVSVQITFATLALLSALLLGLRVLRRGEAEVLPARP